MARDDETTAAAQVGHEQAAAILARRAAIDAARTALLTTLRAAVEIRTETIDAAGVAAPRPAVTRTAGVLVAEGDSWFDYPFEDVLKLLDDRYGYEIESVARKGDTIEDMAYRGGQLDDFTRRLRKLLRHGVVPKAVLLSGGGNDVAGDHFAMLLNHAASKLPALNDQVVSGVVDQRIRAAYVTILTSVTDVCVQLIGRAIPILVHGYDYPVPDGRGFLGGWWILPGPWLSPGFRAKGHASLPANTDTMRRLMERFNVMLQGVAGPPQFPHVSYVNLRGTLSTGAGYDRWWDNELHPTEEGFDLVTQRFVATLTALP